MRKSVAISLLLIYIIASSGVAIRVHYSPGKLRSVNLILDPASETVCPNIKAPTAACNTKPANLRDKSIKAVLNCMSVMSNGFFEAYDDTDSIEACTTCSAEPIKGKCPAHFVSID